MIIDNSGTSPTGNIFNTPIECGLRSAIILLEIYPRSADLQRLINYDYLLVHSGDVEDGPESIHPATPYRSGELLARRPLIEKGIQLMMSRSIIDIKYCSNGVNYCAGEWASIFIESLTSRYILKMRERAKWVTERFLSTASEDLDAFMRSNWKHWGSEFEYEALLRETEI